MAPGNDNPHPHQLDPQTLKVWLHHRLVAEYPADHQVVPDPQDVNAHLILNPKRKVIARYGEGEFHAIGQGCGCAWVEDDPECRRCHPVYEEA